MNSQERISQLWKLIEKSPDHLTLFMLGKELMDDGQYNESADVMKQCIALKPNYTAAYKLWGDTLRKAGRSAEAIDTYEQGIEVSEQTGDLQAGKEMAVFLKKLRAES